MQEFVIEDNVLVKYNGNSETVVVPEGIKEIADRCFEGNTAIRKVYLPKTNGLLFVGHNAFTGCDLQFIRGERVCFDLCSLYQCNVRDIYGDRIYFDQGSIFPKYCRIHSGKNEETWTFCRDNHIEWVADWNKLVAKEKDAEAAVQLPILTKELKSFRKANRKTVYLNKVLTKGTPYWFCALVFLAVTAAAYKICGNIEVLQQYYLQYLAPFGAGLVSLMLLKIIRLIWKAIRFHNKAGFAYQAYETVTTLEKKIHEHRCNVLTAPALARLDEEEKYLQIDFQNSGFYAIKSSMSAEELDARLRASYGLEPRPTAADPNKDANSKGLATGLAD